MTCPSTYRMLAHPSGRTPAGTAGRACALAVLLTLSPAAALAQAPLQPPAQTQPATPRGDIETGDYAHRAEVQQFAADVAARHGLDPDWVGRQLQQSRHVPAVSRLIMPAPPGKPRDWAAYRARFVEPRRVQAGLAFWQAHDSWLARAETQYGVPAELVVGIIGVETFYGRITGNFRVIDALSTLAFDFPSGRSDRSEFFRGELEHLLVWGAREGLDVQGVRGSFAGAVGLPQFMPGSINRYAVDFDGDGRIDLQASAADAIGSVAHYLQQFGWQTGMPTHYPVQVPQDAAQRATLLAPDILPTFSAAQFAEYGAVLDSEGSRHTGPLALVELFNGVQAPSYVAGTQNFYAVTRYNWSSYYALAVIELGQAVAAARAASVR
jgi:membrane-bound lytic murein transglycosylase B